MKQIEILRATYPDRVSLTPTETGHALWGWSPKTTSNRLSEGRFPLPIRLIGGRKVVLITDIADALDPPLKKGAPQKWERVEAARRGVTVPVLREQLASETARAGGGAA